MIYPERGWSSKVEYDETLSSLAVEFMDNFKNKFKDSLENFEELEKYGPTLDV